MRAASTILPVFWTRGTGKALRGNSDAQLLAVYLMSCPYGSMTGIFCVAIPTIAYEIGITPERVRAAFDVLHEIDFARYDEDDCVVYLPGGMATQVGETISRGDKRVTAIVRELRVYTRHPFFRELLLKYGETHAEALSKLGAPSKGHAADETAQHAPSMPLRSPFDAPSMPLRSPFDAPSMPLRSPFDAPSKGHAVTETDQHAPSMPLRRGMQLENPNCMPLKTKTKSDPLFLDNFKTNILDQETAGEGAHARDGESAPASASQIRVVAAPAAQPPPERAESAPPAQEASDPLSAPPRPQSVAAIGIQSRPLPASESRLMGTVWIEAYTEAARATWEDTGWSFDPAQLKTLERVISSRCVNSDRGRIVDWLRENVTAFFEAVSPKRQFYSGGQPAGFDRWLNSGKPTEKAQSAPAMSQADYDSSVHPSRRRFRKDGTFGP